MVAFVNGMKLEGTPQEILEMTKLFGVDNTSATKQHKIDYNSQGIESSIPTPAMPKKTDDSTTKAVKCNWKAVEVDLNGKKVWRIPNGVWYCKANKSAYAVAKQYLAEATKNCKTAEFTMTCKNRQGEEYERTYTSAYMSKATADKILKTLPTHISVNEQLMGTMATA